MSDLPFPMPAHEFMSAAEVARHLGVNIPDLKRLIAEGVLRQPIELGPRDLLWPRTYVESLSIGSPKKTRTPRSTFADPPGRPLTRTHDVFVRYAVSTTGSRAHVRVWEGPAPEGQRLVVVIGAPTDRLGGIVNFVEDLATSIDEELLERRGAEAIWFDYFPGSSPQNPTHRFDNIVFHVDRRLNEAGQGSSKPRRTRRPDQPRFTGPSWLDAGLCEVERVLGQPVECYPEPAYTEATIESWQRSGTQVDVPHDVLRVRAILANLTRLGDVPADNEHAPLAESARRVLVEEIRARHDSVVTPWDDGTQARTHRTTDRSWPSLFAAQLVPLTLPAVVQRMLADHAENEPWPWDDQEMRRRKDLLAALRRWMDDCDEYGDHPDGALHRALTSAADSLAFWLGVADPTFRDSDHPDSRPRVFTAEGEQDRRYLGSVRWEHAEQDSRAHRQLRALFLAEEAAGLRFGRDPWSRLVGITPDGRQGPRFAVEWPLRPEGHIPDASFLVADGAGGARPVYVELPDGTLDLLPRQPDRAANEWNFGYGGGGPGSLTYAILRTFELVDGVPFEHLPYSWVDEQVSHSSKEHLRISVRELRRRIGPPSGTRAEEDDQST